MSKLNSRDELIPGKAYKVKGVMFLCQCLLPAKYDSMYNKSVANPDDILIYQFCHKGPRSPYDMYDDKDRDGRGWGGMI